MIIYCYLNQSNCSSSGLGSANDHPGGIDVRVMLDSAVRRDGSHSAAACQLPASLTVPIHDARHSLGRIQQQCGQPAHLRCHELSVQTQLQTGRSTPMRRHQFEVGAQSLAQSAGNSFHGSPNFVLCLRNSRGTTQN